jgi:hypothetical protein
MSPSKPWLPDIMATAQNTAYHDKTLPPSYRASVGAESSLDILQRIERKLARYNASQNVFKRWLFEILSVTTSAFCMGENN